MQSSEEAPIIKDGVRIDGLQVLRVLHDDGFAVSASAKRIGKSGRLLLQILNPDRRRDALAIERFEKEAAAHGMMEHASLSSFVDMGRAEGLVWYARQWTEGPSLGVLARQLEDVSYIPYGHVAQIFAGLARALHEAHTGIIRGEPYGVPFGMMRAEHIRLDRRGRFTLGGYQPQDIARPFCQKTGALPQTDLRRLAELLFELSVGKSLSASMREAGLNQPPPPSSIVLGFPEDLEDILMCALSPDESSRFPDGVALASVLENFAATSRWQADDHKVLEWVTGLFPSWRLELEQTSWGNDFGNGPSTDEVTAWFTPPSFEDLLESGADEADPNPPAMPKTEREPPAPVRQPQPARAANRRQHYADQESDLHDREFFDDETPSVIQDVLAEGRLDTLFDEAESPVPGVAAVRASPPDMAPPPPRRQFNTSNQEPEPVPQAQQWSRAPSSTPSRPPAQSTFLEEEHHDEAPPPPPAAALNPEDPGQLASALAASVAHKVRSISDEAKVIATGENKLPLTILFVLYVFTVIFLLLIRPSPSGPTFAGDKELVAGFILGEAETLLAENEHMDVELALREVRLLGKISPTSRARAERVGEDLDIARKMLDVQRAMELRQYIQVVDECERILRQRPGHEEVISLLKQVIRKSEGRGTAGAAADRAKFLVQNGG